MYDGTFPIGDLCNFRISNPTFADFNDVMYLKVQYVARAEAILIKGESLENPTAMYNIIAG